ncbi:MAG TPA: phosphoribosylformylglycinamidine cyclo-ligase [Bacteroidetes bacterium]|nr:phosphoribosylformylglycinamidine cyclo-ligase [Bacteroidota bacterium]HCN36177.1 phosphoribosylformylglycinamidine cyclo-ligase [Bacteroidota bacterium]
MSYKNSGVDIKKGDKLVDIIKPVVKKTFTNNVLSGIGNFGAFYKIPLKSYKNPVFVSSVDGVGTKLKIASEMGIYDTIGEDLVNHCVNDIAVCGAKPLFFLDYYATGKLNVKNASQVIKGLAKACKENNCSLIGGETAEMPGLYQNEDFDLAGSITGIVEKSNILDKKNVKKDDVLIGLESSGLHTNGYSLVRKIFKSKKDLQKYYDEFENILGYELLQVHRSYLNIIQSVLSNFKINAISHITGGGIEGNTKRVINKNNKLVINWKSWDRPEIFKLIQKKGNVDEKDMRRTFNLGIGLIFIVNKKYSDKLYQYLIKKNETPYIIGEIK